MTTFNIGTQNAATVQNIGGGLTVYGGIHGSARWQSLQVRAEIERAIDEVARIPLEPEARAGVDGALTAAAADAAAPDGDRNRVAELLAAATGTLREAGALANAGTGLAVALRRAAALLGPLGASILALL
jgi:hypothetical protein